MTDMKKGEKDEKSMPINESGAVKNEVTDNEMPKEQAEDDVADVAVDESNVENAGTPAPDDNGNKCDNVKPGKEDENETVTEEKSIGPDLEQLLAEAEARGYERGRNEGIEAWMNEGRRVLRAERDDAPEGEVMILNNMRRSVWA